MELELSTADPKALEFARERWPAEGMDERKKKAFLLSVKLKLSCLYVHSFYLRQPASQGKDLKSEWKAIPQSFMKTLFKAYIASFKAQ